MRITSKLCACVAAAALSACSNHIQDQLSMEFEPVYPVDPVQATQMAPTGAIYSSSAPGLFAADRRAARIGDLLTVEFTERFSANDTQNTTTSRSDSFEVDLPEISIMEAFDDARLDMGANRGFSGQGLASQSNSLTGRLAVTVTRVLPGGNLEVVGQRRLAMTSGNEYVRLRGVVRPQDISPENIVFSDRIANADIQYVGAGEVSDSSRQGWLRRAMNTVSPL